MRAVRRIAVVVVVLLGLSVALPPQGAVLKPGGFPLSWLRSLLSVSVGWASPMPPTPRQESGTAAGRSHNASTSDTRAGSGAGHPRGTGQGELPAYVPAAAKVTAGRSAKGGHGFDPATSRRDATKSTATSTYFTNADGSYTKRIMPTPVNFRDGAGNWQPIDTSLRRAGDGRWQETANSLMVGFAAAADDPNLVTVGLDGTHTVSYGLAGAAAVTGVASGSAITYPAALPGTDVRLTSSPSGMREDLVLRSVAAGNSWQFPLDLHGMTASVAKDGSVELDAAGKRVGSIPPSYAYDAKVDPKSGQRSATHATRYDLATVGGRTVLTLTVDAGWLRDRARVFPITVDPSITDSPTTYAASGDPGDHSMEDYIKIGSYDSGTHADRSFLQFPASGIDNSQISVSAASLDLFVTRANGCPTPQRLDVAPVTQDWTPSTVTSFPGPSMGASIGNLTPSTPNACANNTAGDPAVGDWVTVPLSVATFNGWANGSVKDYGLGVYASETDSVHWKYLGSAFTNQPRLTLTYTGNVAPAIVAQYPNNGAQVTTLSPLLSAEGTIDPSVTPPNPNGGPQFQYQVYDSAGTKVADSGLVNGAYQVPAGTLQWAKTYVWEVQAFDGANYSPNPSWYQLTTQVPQPYITSGLSQNAGGHGFDPAIGNYTTSATDADIPTVGPSLSVVRDYNSRDPRLTGAFGAAWSSMFDARAVERYAPSGEVSTVVVTYPDGSEVGYARNADGSFTPPLGRAAKMIKLADGYEVVDKADTDYRFTQSLGTGVYGIGSVTDANGRAETFTWSGGHITVATSAVSSRSLHLNWVTPPAAGVQHVGTVVTDPVVAGQSATALTWTYGYTGDQLTSVCPPGTTTACTTYGYKSGSPYYSQALDLAPKSFWPLAETSGSTAASAVLASEGTDAGTYSNVTLANTAGPLAGSSVQAASFNGTSSMVQLPNLHVGQSLAMSISLWFKTAPGAGAGVLFSSSDMPITPTATRGNYQPTLYVGSDGKLLGQWWFTNLDTPTPIVSSATVNDGAWHHVVLTGSAASQVMYLDGAQAGSMSGWGTDAGFVGAAMPWLLTHNYLGTGFLGGLPWPDNPYTNDSSTLHAVYFNGSIADASFYDNQLTQPDVTALYQTATHGMSLLNSITHPSGKAYAAIDYAPVSGSVTSLTDENGGSWSIAAPTVAGSSQVYRASVLGAGPFAYYRLGEAAGTSQAASEVKYGTGTYANTTLGGAGKFADEPAPTFDGTSSSVSLPAGVVNGSGAQSWGLWFTTTATGGVLLSTQASTLGGSTCPCMPMLWVSSDGKLRGLAPSTTPTGPLTGGIAGKCVDDNVGGTADGNPIQLWTCNGSGPQSMTVNADGTVRVLGKCMDVTGSGTGDGTKVQLYTCNGTGAQVWQPYSGGLRNPESGKCLDDPSSSTTDGTQLQIFTCNNTNAQHWTLSLTSSTPVNDGKWHQAVLTSTGTVQTLYVDGVKTQSTSGPATLTAGPQPYTYLGGGYTDTGWSNLTPATTAYFNGGLAEVAAYRSELSSAQVAAQFDAARNSSGLTPVSTVRVTDPGSKTLTYEYDPLHGNRMIASTDGREFRTSYGYDASGFLNTTTDPNGAVTTTGHDADGNEVSKTTCQNQSANVCSTTYMTYKANSMGVDQAKGATATASSTYPTGWSLPAVVDGNTTTTSGALGWSSLGHSTANNTEWLQLDMGSARPINRVDLYPRTDIVGAGFPQAFTIAVSTDGSTWTTVTTQTNYPDPTTPAPASFGFTAQSARYIKLNATTLRTDTFGTYYLQLSEVEALNDLPDPTAGVLLTQRDPRSSSGTDNTYLTSYGYDAVGDVTSVTGPPVPGFPNGRTSTVAYTDGTTVPAADSGYAPAGLPYRTVSAGGATYTVGYKQNGDVASSTDADGLVTRYTYDNLGRVATKTVNSGKPSGWWPLNQTSGTVVPDASGVGNTGTATGVTWSGGVGVFGGNSKVTVGQPIVNTAASFTLSGWVNLAAIPTSVAPVVAVYGGAATSAELSYSTGAGTWKFQTSDRDVTSPTSKVLAASASPALGSWTHLVGVYDATSGVMTFYVNGTVNATATTTHIFTGKTLAIGGNMNASIANVQVYQRALSASDVTALYGAGYNGTAISDTTPSGLVSSYGYDGEDRVTSEVDPPVTDRITGAVHTPHTTTVFDPDGNVHIQTVADDTGGDASRTRITTYNQYDQVQTSTDAQQNSTSYTYDGYGNKASETDPMGTRTTYTYDPNGHVLTQVLDNYTGDPVNPQPATQMTEESRAYDPAGRLASITNAMGNTTRYTYTDDGLPVTATRTDSAGNNPFVLRSDTYDAAGNIVQEATNNGATTTTTTLDAASRPTVTRQDPSGLNRATTVSYTADDQVSTTTRTDGSGATLVTSATYDPMGHVTSKSVDSDGAGHPAGWWRLDQSGGSTVVDASGTGNTATVASGVKWSGSSATFNGTTGAISTNGPVLTTNASYSVSAWVNLTAVPTAFQTAVSQDSTVNAGFYLQYSPTDNAWAFGQTTTDTTNSSEIRAHAATAPTPATWYHLVGTYDSSTGAMTLYVNGSVAGSATNAAPFAASGPLAIGRARYNSASDDFFNGQIANVQVYQRVLSPAEVSTLYGGGAGRTSGTVASSNQLTTSWRLDQRGLPLSMTDADGNTTNYAYDEGGHLAVSTAPAVSVESGGVTPVTAHPVTMHGYNTFGNEVEQQDPDGNTVTTVYDADSRPVSTTLPSYTPPGSSTPIVPVTVRTYNGDGELKQVSDPLVHNTGYLYDQLGDLAQVTDANGGLTHDTYDLNGQRLSATDPSGAQVQATYDDMGRRITSTVLERYPSAATYTTTYAYTASTTDPGGAWLSSQTSPSNVVTSYGYDNLGEQTSLTDGAGNTTSYQYDYLGRTAATVMPDNTSTAVAYDQSGNPTSSTIKDTTGTVLATRSATYDGVGNMLSSTDARQTTTTFTHDALGHMTQEVQPDTTTTAITTSFGYDAAGNRTRFTDGRHNSWIYTYNPWNLPQSEIEPATATYSADADRTFTTSYDATGLPVRQSQPGGVTLTATYDPLGELKTQSGTGADAATADRSFDYDPAGRIKTAQTGAAGSAPATAEAFTYNDRGLLLTATGAAGNSSFSYTPDGAMATRTDTAGATTYTYDTGGRLFNLIDPASGTTLTYHYNTLDQVSSVTYGSGGDQRTFDYDGMHRLKTDTLKTTAGAVMASIGYGYDPNSNLTSKTTTGFTGSASNTYGYDLANRITSWTAGTSTVTYGYDASGNRTQVGANVYTYDARDELTSDGTNTYTYTARGTLASQTTPTSTVTSTSDAYGQAATQGTQTYAYDAAGRLLTTTPATGTATQLSYTGTGNTVASDGNVGYTRDPAGGLIGIGNPGGSGGGVLALTDQHTDVVGDFTPTGATLAGSTTYDPFGTVLATSNQAGHLGYQSEWTDQVNGQVNMAARWYNPTVGQFTSRDTIEQPAAPASAAFNPFAYANDNPLTGTDPTGHSFWSGITSGLSSAWHATTSFVSNYIVHPIVSAATATWDYGVHLYNVAINKLNDAFEWTEKKIKQELAKSEAQLKEWKAEADKKVEQAKHEVATAYHDTTQAVSTATEFVQHHAAAIGSFVVSTAVFMGCEAALGALTTGVGAVAGAVACGALSGAVGGLFNQGVKCFDGQKGACSAGAFFKAGAIGGVVGGLAGLGGALGGKILSTVGGKALAAIGGLFGRGSTEVAEGLAVDTASSTVDTAADGVASGAARSGTRDAAADATDASSGGEVPRGEQPGSDSPTNEPRAGDEPGNSCSTSMPAPTHSFTGSTPVLMADGHTKPIDQIKAGDQIRDAIPGDSTDRTHTVQAVIVTTTDHDFVDVTVTPTKQNSTASRLAKAALATAAGVIATAALLTAQGGTLTTTYHHPFYDRTQAAFIDAKDLHVGDQLQTPDGGITAITALRLYHSTQITYDLTIDGLHTYYVVAGNTPVLVHNSNCGPTETDAKLARSRAEELQGVRDDYPNAADHGTTSVIGVFNKTTKQWTNHIAINGDGEMPSTWTLRAGEKFVQGDGHAEETILNNLGPDEVVGFGGTSRNICRDTCYPMLNNDGMRFGGAGYFGGRADKTPFSYFWQEGW